MKPANNLNRKPMEIPTNSLTSVIDCSVHTNIWKIQPISLVTDNHEHLTLNEKVNIYRSSQKARYKRQLVLISVRTIMKEERCYLPDGTILEMKEKWKSDQPTPSPTEE